MTSEATEPESGSAERLIFFSDAVVAIAITLLALELPVPQGANVHTFWHSVHENSGQYLAFLISFGVIALAWTHHHHVFRFVERSDSRLRSLNMLWLLTIVLLPFATKLLTIRGHDSVATHALRYGFYSLVEVVATGTFLVMTHYFIAHGLQSPRTPAHLAREADWASAGALVGFGLSIPVFFLTTQAWILWIVFMAGVPRWRMLRSRLARRKSGPARP